MANARGDFDRNNLDCLRLIFASTVALFHVSALTQLPAFEPLGRHLSPHFAVRSFFVISGMLVYRSYIRSSSIRSYSEKRIKRIYPGYVAVIVFAAVALFPLSSSPASQYFAWGFWKYLSANLLFLNFLAPCLPGVFGSNNNLAVNGALWTLKIEVVFYALVPILAFFFRRFGTNRILAGLAVLSCLWRYGLWWIDRIHGSATASSRSIYGQLQVQFPGELIYFCAGILLVVHFDWLKGRLREVASITAFCCAIDLFTRRETLDVIWISGIILVFGFWRYFGNFSKYGDFSYGIYIIHWPILQVLIVLGGTRLNPLLFLAVALPLIFIGSLLLWHLVERRFLARRSHYRKVSVPEALVTT